MLDSTPPPRPRFSRFRRALQWPAAAGLAAGLLSTTTCDASARARSVEPPAASGDFQIVEVPDATKRHAVCNDGTPMTYFVRPGRGPDRDKWVVHLRGGGLCTSVEECKRRQEREPYYMTAATPDRAPHSNGIFDPDPDINPWANWTAVFVPYCSSDTFIGNNGASRRTGGFHFRGHAIVKAIFEDLREGRVGGMPKLKKADELLLTGGSAGGIGVRHQIDRVAKALPGVRVRGVHDAWYVPIDPSKEPTSDVLDAYRTRRDLWHPVVDDSCRRDEKHDLVCLHYQIVTERHVSTPTFTYMDILDPGYYRHQEIKRASPEGIKEARRLHDGLSPLSVVYATSKGDHVRHVSREFYDADALDDSGQAHSYAEILANWVFESGGPTKALCARP